jgi:hypothetical protein
MVGDVQSEQDDLPNINVKKGTEDQVKSQPNE